MVTFVRDATLHPVLLASFGSHVNYNRTVSAPHAAASQIFLLLLLLDHLLIKIIVRGNAMRIIFSLMCPAVHVIKPFAALVSTD
jgi:hypothetical protein